MTDPIADMIVALKNAGDAGRENVAIPYSKMKESIARVLQKEGFIKDFKKVMRKEKPVLEVELHLEGRKPKIRGVKRISKTSKRIYKKSSEVRPVKSGYGVLVMTTPAGVMSGREARRAKVGGEALFSIW